MVLKGYRQLRFHFYKENCIENTISKLYKKEEEENDDVDLSRQGDRPPQDNKCYVITVKSTCRDNKRHVTSLAY